MLKIHLDLKKVLVARVTPVVPLISVPEPLKILVPFKKKKKSKGYSYLHKKIPGMDFEIRIKPDDQSSCITN